MTLDRSDTLVPDDDSRLILIKSGSRIDSDFIARCLKQDSVVLVRDVDPEEAERVVFEVADRFHLTDGLTLQAGFARALGHRRNISRYLMTVNERGHYQFIPPHSEGSSFGNIQLASFYCFENTTDGGETILMNVDSSTKAWELLRERVRRGRMPSRSLARHEILRARGLYKLNLPADSLREDDCILRETETEIPELKVLDVLAQLRTSYSEILDQHLYVYWDTVGSIDVDSAPQFLSLLKQSSLLRGHVDSDGLSKLDYCSHRRIWCSGAHYKDLFKCKVIRRLASRDLIIQNNLTWVHSASNWTPGSGTRSIAAAFA